MRLIQIAAAAFAVAFSTAALAQAPSPNEILLGQSVDLSGPASPRQKLLKEASDAYIRHVNGKGGVNGRKIRVISLDNKGDKDTTVANIAQLVEKDKVMGIFMMSGTSNVTAVLPYLQENKVPLFGITSGSMSLRKHHPYLYHYKASYGDELEKLAAHLAAVGISRVGIIYLRSGFGKENLGAAEAAMAAKNLQVIAKAEVAESGEDAPAAASIVAKAKPQAVILVSVSGTAPKIVAAYRALDDKATLLGLSVLSSDLLYKELQEKVRGIIIAQTVPYPWDRSIKIVAEYQDVMKAMGVKDISVAGMEGYLSARMLVDSLRTGGRGLTRESLVRVLDNTGEQNLGGYRYAFTSTDHNGSKYVDITLIGKGGKLLR
ncbi:hypothetical protein BWI17_16230 [Betaproteobacteria bacterium GR16-43]|nr:hypothetical protein BWI17_16230 [Betaproteobacteria bacterium GR16-43]